MIPTEEGFYWACEDGDWVVVQVWRERGIDYDTGIEHVGGLYVAYPGSDQDCEIEAYATARWGSKLEPPPLGGEGAEH